MQYNVAQLMKERTGATRTYPLRENIQHLDPELNVLDELVGSVKLLRLRDGVLVTGELRTRIELTCDRCLAPIAAPIQFTLAEEFQPTLDIVSGEDLEMLTDDDANLIDAHHILDLSEVIRQHIVVSQPMHPLCKADCKGLCPHCGQNWNEGLCQCPTDNVDPRWAKLLELQRK
jgi:uncharacterized protein